LLVPSLDDLGNTNSFFSRSLHWFTPISSAVELDLGFPLALLASIIKLGPQIAVPAEP
jgi:hypothetical protein